MPLTITWEHLPDGGAPQVGITVSGVVGTQPVTVEVSWDGGVSWRGVRGARLEPVTETAFFRDFVPPLNTPIRYRVTCADGSQAVSAQFQPGAVVRRNLVTDPRATSTSLWSQSWGAGGAGTETAVTDATDGPVLPDGTRVTTYMRYTVTTPGTGASHYGFSLTGAFADAPPLTPGDPTAGAIYARVSEPGLRIRGLIGAYLNTGANAVSAYTPYGPSVPGEWVRLTPTSTQPDWAALRIVAAQIEVSASIPPGTTIDVTCAMAEPGATSVRDYFDGDTAPSASGIPAWVGARNASASVMWEAVDRVQSDTAWAQDPLNPKGAVAVATYIDGPGRVRLMRGSATEVSRPQPVDLAYVQGASSPVASVGTRSTPVGVPLVLRPLLDLAADQGALVKSLRDLIDTAGQVVLRGLPIELGLDPVAHYVAPGVVERPSLGGVLGYHEWEMSLTQVRPQSLRVVVPWWSYADVAAIVQAALAGDTATYANVLSAMQAGTTYLDALRDPRVLVGG